MQETQPAKLHVVAVWEVHKQWSFTKVHGSLRPCILTAVQLTWVTSASKWEDGMFWSCKQYTLRGLVASSDDLPYNYFPSNSLNNIQIILDTRVRCHFKNIVLFLTWGAFLLPVVFVRMSMPSTTANWHWKNKNDTRWAKEWFEQELITITVKGDTEGELLISCFLYKYW